jgi:uncharacterized protein YhjY with autotransporter beta-barrel domain
MNNQISPKPASALLAIGLATLLAAPSLKAQLQFRFQQQAGSTVVTGGGSAMTTAEVGFHPINARVGFYGISSPAPLFTDIVPPQWVAAPTDVFIPGVVANGGSTLVIYDGANHGITGLEYVSGPGLGEGFYMLNGGLHASLLATASGTAVFANPFTDLFASHTPGTVLVVIPGVLHFIIGIAPEETVVTTAGGRRRVVRSYRTTNYSAIASAEGSGMMMGHLLQSTAQGAADTVLRDLRGEIFDNGTGTSGASGDSGVASTFEPGSGPSLLRYLAFVQDEHMSYQVALGLAEPERRTVEVNLASTLGGGLPYAMLGLPMAGGAATVQVVEAAGGKAVIEDAKAVVEAAPLKNWRLFASGDFSFYDQDPLGKLTTGFETDSYAGSLGIDYRVSESLKAGLAWSYVQSDTNGGDNVGDVDLEGNMVSAYATTYWRDNWFDLVYSYGSFNNETSRHTGLGSTARGDTDSDSHNIRLNMGHNIAVGRSVTTGPVAGLRYGTGDVDPYSERGGSVAALDYAGTDFESMVSRVGWQASHVRPTGWGRIVSQVRVAWEHEYLPENGTVSGSLQTSPFALVTGGSARSIGGYTASSDGAHPGTDWLSAGAGVKFELLQGFSLLADYEGVFFRSDAGQHYASAKVSYEW